MRENLFLDRRGFFKAAGIAAGGVVLAACQKRQPENPVTPWSTPTVGVEATEGTSVSACEEVGNICIHDSADSLPGQGVPQSCTTTSDGKPVNRIDDKGYCVKAP